MILNSELKKEIVEKIDKNDVISFDIFDTLILRNIFCPTDIFKILSKKENLEKKAEKLVNMALERGGSDNISVVVAQND